ETPAASDQTPDARPQMGGTLTTSMLSPGAQTHLPNWEMSSGGDWNIAYNFYDTIVEYDESANAVSTGLASAWEQPDNNVCLISFRPDVSFRDGTPFSAEAFKYNIDYSRDPANRATGRYQVEYVDRVDVVDEFTAQVVLDSFNADFILQL